MKQALKTLHNFLVFFLLVAAVITCCLMLFTSTLQDSIGRAFTQEEITAAAKATMVNVFLISAVMAFGDYLRRKFTVVRPVKRITEAANKMIKGDFSVRVKPVAKFATDDSFNEIIECINKMAEELSGVETLRTDFIANVSHELKTPIALIQGYAEGLKECINDDAQSRDFYCEVIMDEADKMNQMVKKLLTLNQLESGNETITMERFDVTELIRGVLHSVDILIGQSGITVTECPAEPIYVWADEFMTEEVVTNYLSNAIHYAGGKKEISIRCREQEKNVRISVFNTGDPIPEEDIDKIWFKFYKVDKARTREYGGSGIGLSIVKAIMDSFHQRCGVINHEDGVEFWFELEKGKQS